MPNLTTSPDSREALPRPIVTGKRSMYLPSANRPRRIRIQNIVDGAAVREHLGQDALHERLPDGSHEVVFRGQRFTAPTVDAAIAAAREGGE